MAADDAKELAPAPEIPGQANTETDARAALSRAGNLDVGETALLPPTEASAQRQLITQGFPVTEVSQSEIVFSAQPGGPQSLESVTSPGLSGKTALEIRNADVRASAAGLLSVSNVDNPQQMVTDALNATDKLLAAAPGPAQQAAFSEIMDKALRDYPTAIPGTFGRILTTALKKTPDSNLDVLFNGTIAVLRDSNAVSAENPVGMVGAAFQGYGEDSLSADKAVFDTAGATNRLLSAGEKAVPPGKEDAYKEALSALYETLKETGLLTPTKDLPAREPPETPPDLTAQTAALRARFGDIPLSDQTVSSVLAAANDIAFANPTEMQQKFADSLKSLTVSTGLEPKQLVSMLAASMNIVTASNSFSVGGQNGYLQTDFIRDARLSTPENPKGNFALAVVSGRDSAADALALDTAIKVSQAIRAGAAPFKAFVSPAAFVNDVENQRAYAAFRD